MYKGQGRIQRALLTRIYKGFLVHEGDYNPQPSIPTTLGIARVAQHFSLATL